MKAEKKVFGKLFLSSFSLSAFTFGGGYVIIPLMKRKFVEELHWMEEEEMLNFTAIAQSSPGAVAVNAAVLVGYRVAGLPGALTAVLGTILPPMIVLSVISLFYTAFRDSFVVAAVLKGMRAGVVAVIADVVYTMGKGVFKERRISSVLVMAAAFLAAWAFGVNVVFVILACGLFGALRAIVDAKRGKLQ